MVLLIKHYFKVLLDFKKLVVLLFILYLVFSELASFSGMLASIVFPIIIVCYITNKIENKDEEKLLNTLPINKEDIVISKYLFVFISVLGFIILTYLISLIKGSIIMLFTFDSVYMIFISLIISMSIYLPFRFSKRIILPKISNYLLSFYLVYTLSRIGLINQDYKYNNGQETTAINFIMKLYEWIRNILPISKNNYNYRVLNLYNSIGMLGALVIFIISMVVSIKIYRRREFI